jgi:hypothetical protein
MPVVTGRMDGAAMDVYTLHEDAGHSWLEVPIQELLALGIAQNISPFSYTDGAHAYLEEDMDMQTFLRARKAMRQSYLSLMADVVATLEARVIHCVTPGADPSPVRSLDRFTPPEIPVGMPVL